MAASGLKINEAKTEICIFHRNNLIVVNVNLNNKIIKTMNTINILGILFDSQLKWNEQYVKTIKEANMNLYAIKRIAKFFLKEERSTLITSLFYSKLYYGSEVWHLPERTASQNKMIKYASANALRSITNEITIFHTHTHTNPCNCRQSLA